MEYIKSWFIWLWTSLKPIKNDEVEGLVDDTLYMIWAKSPTLIGFSEPLWVRLSELTQGHKVATWHYNQNYPYFIWQHPTIKRGKLGFREVYNLEWCDASMVFASVTKNHRFPISMEYCVFSEQLYIKASTADELRLLTTIGNNDPIVPKLPKMLSLPPIPLYSAEAHKVSNINTDPETNVFLLTYNKPGGVVIKHIPSEQTHISFAPHCIEDH